MTSDIGHPVLRPYAKLTRVVRAATFVALGLCPVLSACANQDLDAAPSSVGNRSMTTSRERSRVQDGPSLFIQSDARPAASLVPDWIGYAEWSAQHTPVDVTLRRMLRPARSMIAPAVTCDPNAPPPGRGETSTIPLFAEDPTRCVVNPDSLAAGGMSLQFP
ncbi:MAG TPA: hypothetical protein VFZ21_09200 [Gemmatimonadaceae bacterium]|jgi:hypothetical protein|nr:hypothetical protein [Gemmatimonadaceae bacterium]